MTVQDLINILNSLPDKSKRIFTYNSVECIGPALILVESSERNEYCLVSGAEPNEAFYILRDYKND